MNKLELKIYPDPCLRIKTKPVDQFTKGLSHTLRSMADIMYTSQGIGLAATQVGLGMSLFVIDVGEGLVNFVNPEILEASKEKSRMEEGCLSVPGVTVNISRPERIKVRAQDEHSEFFIKKFDGLTARAFQHEIDHLRGRLIIDHLDPIRCFLAKRKLVKTKKEKSCEVICYAGKRDK